MSENVKDKTQQGRQLRERLTHSEGCSLAADEDGKTLDSCKLRFADDEGCFDGFQKKPNLKKEGKS